MPIRLPSLPRSGAALVALSLLVTAMPLPAAAQAPALDRKAIEQIVREYILQNPEIITEAVSVLEQRQQEAAAKAVVEAIRANQADLLRSPTSPVMGNPRGDVTLVEFFDYQCGFCKRAHPQRAAAVQEDGKVRVVMKEFPILGPASVEASKAALAARNQGRYDAMHEALMTHQGPLNSTTIRELATKVGLDLKRLEKDMESAEVQAEIDANHRLGRALGIQGTPGFVIGDTLVPGMIGREAFAQLFATERAARRTP